MRTACFFLVTSTVGVYAFLRLSRPSTPFRAFLTSNVNSPKGREMVMREDQHLNVTDVFIHCLWCISVTTK